MNYPHSTRRLALAVAIASSLAIAGCDTSNEKMAAPPKSDASSYVPGVAPVFNPFTKALPLNIDLLFNGTTDGTADAGSPDNAVISALNDLDGFSTTAYFDIAFDGSIDPATVVAKGGPGAGQNVYLVPLDTGTEDALPLGANILGVDAAAATAFSLSKVSATVVSLDGGTNNVLRVAPEEPLLPSKKYLVFTTNSILDASGNSTTSSGSYFAIKDTTNTSLNPALQPVRTLINSVWEAIGGGFINAFSGGAISVDDAKASITIAYSFTTTDPHKPLLAMAAPRAAISQSQIADGEDPGVAVGNAVNLDNAGLLSTPKERALDINAGTKVDISALTGGVLAAGVGELYTGYIELPSYLPVANPAVAFDPTFLGGNWTADLTLAGAIGKTVPADIDGSYNVTYRYPFAAKTTEEAVPLQVTLPNPTVQPTSYAGTPLDGQTCASAQPLMG